MIENEIRILEIDKEKFILEIEKLGAKKVGDWVQKRKIYDFHPKREKAWIRLRTNGEKSTLTIKEILDNTKIDGIKEIEIEVSDFEKTALILKELGYTPRSYQENKRIRYIYEEIEIDIDTWPKIPTYVEIEGKNKEAVENFLNKISYDKEKLTTKDVESIYHDFYKIDMNEYPILTFDDEEE